MSPGMGMGGMTPQGSPAVEDALVNLINWISNPDVVEARIRALSEAAADARDAADVLAQAEANVKAERAAVETAAASAREHLANAEAALKDVEGKTAANIERGKALDERERAFNQDSSTRLADLNARAKALDDREAKVGKRAAHAEKMLADAEAIRADYQARVDALGQAMTIVQTGKTAG